MAEFRFTDLGGDHQVVQSFTGTGEDTLVATFTHNGISNGDRVETTFTENPDGSFTATYHNFFGDRADAVTISGVRNIHIATPDRYTWTDGNVYDNETYDIIRTGHGDDVISTFAGQDKVDSGRGDDIVDGGKDFDGIAKDLSDRSVDIVWNAITNSYSGPGAYTNFEYFLDLKTGSGNDIITTGLHRYGGEYFNDVISTGAGDDLVTLYGADDVADLGSGTDRLVIDYSGNVHSYAPMVTAFTGSLATGYTGTLVNRGGESVAFAGVENFTILATNAYGNADRITTGDGNDIVSSAAGNDIVDVGAGTDDADGGADIDGIAKDFSTAQRDIAWNLTANTFTGTGRFTNFEYFVDLVTGSGDDIIVTSNAHDAYGSRGDTIATGAGNDRVTVFSGTDVVSMGSDTDRLTIDYRANSDAYAAVTVDITAASTGGYDGKLTNRGDESVTFTGVENFTIHSVGTYATDDRIKTGNGNDGLYGMAGNDVLLAGSGNDTVDGGLGVDGVGKDFSASRLNIKWDLTANTFSGTAGSFKNIEYFADLQTGNGADTIVSGKLSRADVVATGAGNDSASFFGGVDLYRGGAGTDRLIVDYSTSAEAYGTMSLILKANSNGGYNGTVGNRAAYEQVDFTGVESFTIKASQTYARDETIRTGAGKDVLYLYGGSDTLDGGAGADTLYGGTGNDTYIVDNAGDRVVETKDAGTDTVRASISYSLTEHVENLTLTGRAKYSATGNAGANTIIGNTGDNVIDGNAGRDTLTGGGGRDRFVFDDGDTGKTVAGADRITDFNSGDRLDLSAIDAKRGGRDDAFSFIGSKAFTGKAGELHFTLSGGALHVSGDTDGDRSADFLIILDGKTTLSAADLLL